MRDRAQGVRDCFLIVGLLPTPTIKRVLRVKSASGQRGGRVGADARRGSRGEVGGLGGGRALAHIAGRRRRRRGRPGGAEMVRCNSPTSNAIPRYPSTESSHASTCGQKGASRSRPCCEQDHAPYAPTSTNQRSPHIGSNARPVRSIHPTNVSVDEIRKMKTRPSCNSCCICILLACSAAPFSLSCMGGYRSANFIEKTPLLAHSRPQRGMSAI